jgi:hypothetical protein
MYNPLESPMRTDDYLEYYSSARLKSLSICDIHEDFKTDARHKFPEIQLCRGRFQGGGPLFYNACQVK